ncbi:MAG: hypothetical protein R2939_21010 [Kofleriaceae bacterium]
MTRAGAALAWRYAGTYLAIYVAQALLAATAMVATANVLAAEFARRPRFDDAVDGDLVALIEVVRAAPHVIAAAPACWSRSPAPG